MVGEGSVPRVGRPGPRPASAGAPPPAPRYHRPPMRQSLRSWAERHLFNLWPCYRGTGARVTFIASDWSEVRVTLPASLWTRNYVGTIFGGSMYAAVDPFFMIMLMKRLGPGWVVWDREATIRFKRPGRSRLFATFRLPPGEEAAIHGALEHERSADRTYSVDLVDRDGTVHASVEKVVYVRRREEPAPAAGR
jgi:acyl-coenzyme A thioesterase PaaI-like protein